MELANYLKKENIYISDTSRDTSHFYGECLPISQGKRHDRRH